MPTQRGEATAAGLAGATEQTGECVVGRDIYLDLSCTFDKLDDASIARIIAAHGPQRILFASDCPWQLPSGA